MEAYRDGTILQQRRADSQPRLKPGLTSITHGWLHTCSTINSATSERIGMRKTPRLAIQLKLSIRVPIAMPTRRRLLQPIRMAAAPQWLWSQQLPTTLLPAWSPPPPTQTIRLRRWNTLPPTHWVTAIPCNV